MPITDVKAVFEEDGNVPYDPNYWDQIFLLWYNGGRVAPAKLLRDVVDNIGSDPKTKRFPSVGSLKRWIDSEFSVRAAMLDDEVAKQLNEQLVKQKIEMLQRHAEIGRTLQQQALDYLAEHGLGSSRNALVALTEGLRVERESAGVIPFFEKITDLSDDALVNEIKKLINKSPVTIESTDEIIRDDF